MKIIWGQLLGRPECPYIKRWVVDFTVFSIRLHHWYSSDDQRNFHDHPWWFISWVLSGSYINHSPSSDNSKRVSKLRKMWSIQYFPAIHRHTVEIPKGGCWTLLITGPEKRVWGFWVNNKFRKRNKYFFEYGSHPCDKR